VAPARAPLVANCHKLVARGAAPLRGLVTQCHEGGPGRRGRARRRRDPAARAPRGRDAAELREGSARRARPRRAAGALRADPRPHGPALRRRDGACLLGGARHRRARPRARRGLRVARAADRAGARAARAGAARGGAGRRPRPRRRQLDARRRPRRVEARAPARPRRGGPALVRPLDARGAEPGRRRRALRPPLHALAGGAREPPPRGREPGHDPRGREHDGGLARRHARPLRRPARARRRARRLRPRDPPPPRARGRAAPRGRARRPRRRRPRAPRRLPGAPAHAGRDGRARARRARHPAPPPAPLPRVHGAPRGGRGGRHRLGGIQEETTFLTIPCFTLRANTERPITLERGTNTLLGLDPARIRDVPRLLREPRPATEPPAGWDGRAAERIAGVLASLEPARHRHGAELRRRARPGGRPRPSRPSGARRA
jgi:hypothetical protein